MNRLTPRRGARVRGASIVETLVALPILLVAGLGVLQFGLVYQARHALNHAVLEAARAGSVGHAQPDAVRDGLARGLLPWLFGARDLAEYATHLVRTRTHVLEGEALGWIRLERLSPTDASFADWAEPARDHFGAPIAGVREIPNDHLPHRARVQAPASGATGARGGAPVGAASGQTLVDANVLRLRLDYGVPLAVPVVGRLVAWSLRAWDGCAAPAPRRLGALGLDAPPVSPAPRAWTCAMYGAGPDARPRIPVRVLATVRMHSAAREGGWAAAPDPGGPPGAAPGTEAPPTPFPAADLPAPPDPPVDLGPSAPPTVPSPDPPTPRPSTAGPGGLLPEALRPPVDPAVCPSPS